MKMTYSIASRYSKVFEELSNPYALIILDYMFENDEYKSAQELADMSKTTKSKASTICEELCDLYIFDKEFRGSEVFYKSVDGRLSNIVKKIIEIVD